MATHSRSLIPLRTVALAVLAIVTVCMSAVTEAADVADDPFVEYDLVMYERPDLPVTTSSRGFQPGLKELWLKALDRPDPELQRLAIDTFAIAHRRGVKDLRDISSRLITIASEPDARHDVRLAVAGTLVAFDASEHAEALGKLAISSGPSVSQIIEPALVRWKSPVLQQVWLDRIRSRDASEAMLIYAIRGLAALEDSDAVETFTSITTNPGEAFSLRLEAARGLGLAVASGLVDEARTLSQSASKHRDLNDILAAEMLGRHDSRDAVELLSELASHENAAVQSIALRRLYEIDFHLVAERAAELIRSSDVNVRRWAMLAVIDNQKSEQIGLLASLLDDVNPTLRRQARDALIDLHSVPELKDEVIARTTGIVRDEAWRGCEQACVVLTRLDHKPSGTRMVELLAHERDEVKVAAAWGLSELRIEKLLPDMLEHAASVLQQYKSGQLNDSMPGAKTGASRAVAHLFISFGDMLYEPAHELMREYLPKNHDLGIDSRAAAAWAIGLLYEDDVQPDLVNLMIRRVADTEGENPESFEMQQMCAVAIGRMKGESALETLRGLASTTGPEGLACYWAIERITGEPVPSPNHIHAIDSGWFIEPIFDENEK